MVVSQSWLTLSYAFSKSRRATIAGVGEERMMEEKARAAMWVDLPAMKPIWWMGKMFWECCLRRLAMMPVKIL